MKKSFDKGFITPLPVLIIATYDENGTPDAMNAAWGGQVGGSQISISLGKHKTTDNIRLNKEFTVSFTRLCSIRHRNATERSEPVLVEPGQLGRSLSDGSKFSLREGVSSLSRRILKSLKKPKNSRLMRYLNRSQR